MILIFDNIKFEQQNCTSWL